MKFKSILYSVIALTMATTVASCSNEQEVLMPESPGISTENSEKVSFTIKMPDFEMKTRAGQEPGVTYGDDGLYCFTRDIDKLWYAVYNNGTLLYHSMQPGIPQGTYHSTDKTFSLDIQIPRINDQIRLEDYTVFFFAGNALDNIQNKEISDGIGLDFANKTLYAYPAYLNRSVASGEMFNPVQYDFFSKYITLSDVVGDDLKGNVILTRPFCQVSLLTDELCQPAILSTYASDFKVKVDTTPSMYTKNASSTNETLPYGWNYGDDTILTKGQAELALTLNTRAFNNVDNSLSIPQEVTFKNRKMFCTGSFLMLAPDSRKAYSAGSTSERFKFDLVATGNRASTTACVSALVPTGGLKANEKYIMYNRKFNPDTGDHGDPTDPDDKDPDDKDPDKPDPDRPPGGIFSNHYIIDIEVDPNWDNSSNIVF